MRSLLLIAAVLVAGALSLEAGKQCEPGSTFKLDCNTCRCGADGKVMSCTRKFCVPDVQGDDPKAQPMVDEVSDNLQPDASAAAAAEKEEEEVHTNGQVCTPNEVKMEDCNRCKCAANGIGWFCTRKACPPRERRSASEFLTKPKRQVAQPAPPKKECEPGTNFKSADGCNDCFCTATGIAACTQKFCFNTKTKRDTAALAPKKECVPGTTFKSADGCNDCFCSESGHAACTMKFCFPTPPRTKRLASNSKDTQCVPGTSFKSADGCNDCFCSANGMAACTLRFCFFEDQPQIKSKRQANNDELPVSAVAPGAPGFSCSPGKSFKYQCNTCRCDTSGQTAACTFKFCLPGEY
ncbi:AAEL000551-PA [Aedes aegypti]|uniref:AAEL000551-PA n=2 Tax=Aedes aegypti TaxID=7159 RepID=A0A1S4EW67_AEDAE|nr:pacifastin-like protease inhibitor cvp4 [Aedes aegypti]EAT48407.1 AAEL000551-PA [Aedes aegypti]